MCLSATPTITTNVTIRRPRYIDSGSAYRQYVPLVSSGRDEKARNAACCGRQLRQTTRLVLVATPTVRMDEKAVQDVYSPVNDTSVGSIEDDIDYAAEKKIVRKMDLNLISIFGVLYLMSFLGKIFALHAVTEDG